METIEINYKPRSQAKDFHSRTERFAVLVAHRRFGKTVAAINDLIKSCFESKGSSLGLCVRIHKRYTAHKGKP